MKDKKRYSANHLIKKIAFFGDSQVKENDPVFKDAFEIAKMLAEAGYVIVNGGGPGVMYAATSGAQAAKGETLTITFAPEGAKEFEGRYPRNVGDEELVTTNYVERMFKLLEKADMFLIFKGGSGTISEFGTAWVLAKLYYGHHKPFLLFGEHWLGIIDCLKKNMNIDQTELAVFDICTKISEVLPAIARFDEKMRENSHEKDCKICVDRAFTK